MAVVPAQAGTQYCRGRRAGHHGCGDDSTWRRECETIGRPRSLARPAHPHVCSGDTNVPYDGTSSPRTLLPGRRQVAKKIRGVTFEENLNNSMGLEFYNLSH